MRRGKAFRRTLSISFTLMLGVNYLPASPRAHDTTKGLPDKEVLSKPDQIKTSQYTKQAQELNIQQRRDFTRSRDLLRLENVPFDPDDLLDANWREKLSLSFAR